MSETSPEEDCHNQHNAVASTSSTSAPALETILQTQLQKTKRIMVTSIAGAASNAGSMTSLKLPLSSDKPDHPPKPDMNHEEERLKSFENWPSDLVSPKFLAQNGFYSLKHENDVRCAFCKLELRCAAGNDPVKDHKHWAPQCTLFNRQSTKSSRESPVGRDECGPYASTSSGGNLPGPAHPEYATEVGRLRTFKHWPRSMRQKPEDLAEAGFYYTGTGDRTKCFYCNGGISDWELDDVPWKEHARLLSRCPYVHLVKGRDYVQKVISESCALPAESDTKVSCEKNSLKHILDENKNNDEENIDDSNLCRICYAEERNVCFVPCGHVVCCAKCALSTNKCPMCRRVFHNAVRLYFS